MRDRRKFYRQGDVLIERVSSVPEGAVKQKASRRIVLALGEATGHHHALEVWDAGQEADPADWWKAGEETYVEVAAPAKVTHQEHATVPLPPGTYRVTRQREYSPQEVRRVAD